MNWNLSLAINILLGASIALILITNRSGLKYILLYVMFALRLHYEIGDMVYITSLFLLLLVLIDEVEIRGLIILGIVSLTASAVYGIVSLVSIYTENPAQPDIIAIKNYTVYSTIIVGLVYLLPKHRNILLGCTLIIFSVFFYSYFNSAIPFKYLRPVSFPFACLSLIPYLGVTIIGKHYEGSLAQRFVIWSKRRTASNNLKLRGVSHG